MRKFLGILIVLSIVIPYTGTYLWLQHKKKLVKKEVKWKMIAGLDREELVLLQFTRPEVFEVLNWKHSKEFEFKGHMYDIVESEISGDSIFYWCWWDHEETTLNKKLKKLVAKAMGQNPLKNETSKRLIDFFKALYFREPVSLINVNPEIHCDSIWGQPFFYNSLDKSPPVPPPKDV